MKKILIIIFLVTISNDLIGQHTKPIYPEFNWSITNEKLQERHLTFQFQTKITPGWQLVLDSDSLYWGVVIGQGMEFQKVEMIQNQTVVQKSGNKLKSDWDGAEIYYSTGEVVYTATLNLNGDYDFIDIDISYMRMDLNVIIPSSQTIRVSLNKLH